MLDQGIELGRDEVSEPISAIRTCERPLRDAASVELLVLEDPAAALELSPYRHLRCAPGDADTRAVLARSAGESPILFALRAIHRIAAIDGHASALVQAVIVTAPNADQTLLAARALIAQSLLSCLLRAGSGQLVLSSDQVPNAESRVALVALTRALLAQAQASRVTIRLKFGTADVSVTHSSERTLVAVK